MYRILVVSDNALLRNMISLSLVGVQAEIRSIANSSQIETLCRRVLFDIVIVLRCSHFSSGDDIVRAVRPSTHRRPVIYVISWQHSPQTVLGLLESGVDQILSFPLSLQRLKAKVISELERVI